MSSTANGVPLPTSALPASASPRNPPRRPRNRPRRGRNDQAPVAASGEVTANGQSQSQSQPQSQEQRQQQLSRRPKRQQPRPQQPAEPQSQSQSQSQPNGQPQPQQSDASQNGDGRRRQRNPRGKKNNAPGKPTPQNSPRLTAGPGRVFGAGLTRPQNEQAQPELRASAPEFVPGQAVPAPVATEANNTATVEGSATGKSRGPRSRGAKKPKDKVPAAPKPPAPVFDKSTADDITTRIHEDIAHALYECPVCTSEIGRKTKVWSCTHCWTVFHLTCIKKWSSNEGAAVARPRGEPQSADDLPEKRQWRCPGCNLPHETLPRAYTCWCEKESDPRPLPGLPPHSCGQTCSKPRAGCPHPCDSVCHAGPCPPCTAMGPKQTCFCGRHESQRKCLDTDYVNGWSCGEVCGEYLPCMEHMCQRRCHEGLCGACEETVEARCYCGKAATQMLCSAQGEEAESRRYLDDDVQDEEEVDEWTGTFACKDVCGRMFDCGKHLCQKPCHPQDAEIPHCPKSPDMVTHCPCGKTRLSDIDGFTPRTSCEDPVPHCTKPCDKLLPCGHPCPMTCHTGPCNPCFLVVTIPCRCGRSDFKSLCHQGALTSEPPQCLRVCKASLNCGRHVCNERCCPGERKAIERLATRRKLRSMHAPATATDDVEAEHICTRVCGRELKCGQHTCPELCHKGPCGSCREAIFDEISCACGRTIAYPPLPCGTRPPACGYDCTRPKPCGHPQTQHNCHLDEEPCPKCPFLVDKRCTCGKKVMKNQPCYLAAPRCGLVCGLELKCGSHTCRKTCHAPGECEDAAAPCAQRCGKTKKLCPHECTEKCHAPFPCPENTCDAKMSITCPCGRLTEQRRCGMSLEKARAGATFVAPRLSCDDECARLERNRTLASAFNINPDRKPGTPTTEAADGTVPPLPYSDETLDIYTELSTSTTLSTLQSYEAKLHALALSSAKRSVRFVPARAPFRAFVHCLAADWGFVSEAFDPEPNRYVEVYKSLKWCPPAGVNLLQQDASAGIGIRGVSVGEAVRMRERNRVREREARRVAKERAVAAAKERAAMGGDDGDGSGGGWAQVVRKPNAPVRPAPTVQGPAGFEGGSRFGALVLKSGVGKAKAKKEVKEEVVDDWEAEVDKEEKERSGSGEDEGR